MTITAQTSKTGPYNGNGTTTVFSYTWGGQSRDAGDQPRQADADCAGPERAD